MANESKIELEELRAACMATERTADDAGRFVTAAEYRALPEPKEGWLAVFIETELLGLIEDGAFLVKDENGRTLKGEELAEYIEDSRAEIAEMAAKLRSQCLREVDDDRQANGGR